MNVEHLMTRNVVAVSPETPLKEVAAILADRGISGLPVCDAPRHVVGVVSEADILRKEQGLPPGRSSVFDWLFGRSDEAEAAKLAARTAGEAMTTPAVTIDAGRPVAEAAKLMVEQEINRLPVIHGGELIGIVTRADLVRAFRRSDEEIEREIREDVLLHTLWIEPARLELAVENGEVALTGKLETRTEAELAAAYIRRVPGVVTVDSDLTWQVDDLARRTGSGSWEKRVV
jgi:CBS domain-containing protein